MAEERVVTIFGKETWPFTTEAREAFAGQGYAVDYRDVKKSPGHFEEMLGFSRGKREVPVIVEAGRVTVGFGGT